MQVAILSYFNSHSIFSDISQYSFAIRSGKIATRILQKTCLFLVPIYAMSVAGNALAFDVNTTTKVVFINGWDTSYTKVEIDIQTSCGGTWFWVNRDMQDYDTYMARVLTALVSDRHIIISERVPAWCTGQHLYNPRIGII